jgi:hypothetical protein
VKLQEEADDIEQANFVEGEEPPNLSTEEAQLRYARMFENSIMQEFREGEKAELEDEINSLIKELGDEQSKLSKVIDRNKEEYDRIKYDYQRSQRRDIDEVDRRDHSRRRDKHRKRSRSNDK